VRSGWTCMVSYLAWNSKNAAIYARLATTSNTSIFTAYRTIHHPRCETDDPSNGTPFAELRIRTTPSTFSSFGACVSPDWPFFTNAWVDRAICRCLPSRNRSRKRMLRKRRTSNPFGEKDVFCYAPFQFWTNCWFAVVLILKLIYNFLINFEVDMRFF